MILFINACVRPQSRTFILAKKAVNIISDSCEVVNLFEKNIKPLDFHSLSKREEYIANGDFSDSMFLFAKQFSNADEIVIAAPYWDLSFPAIFKCYIESICVNGITFFYNEKGIPKGLCRAKRLIYITTSGGFIPESNYGYNYVKQLCTDFFGISSTVYIKAEGLDIQDADVGGILRSAENEVKSKLR